MMPQSKLCLVEDDAIMGESLCDRFALEGFAFDWHRNASSAMDSIGRESYAAVISDIRLPDLEGGEMFKQLLGRETRLPPFIFITGYGSIDRAVELLKLGARDYVTKPFEIEQLIEKTRALAGAAAVSADTDMREAVLGVSPAMRRLEEMLPRLAVHANTVLITGESGVGKERVAQLLHRHRDESGTTPLIAVNCGALSETLLESELFGYERGAFTGAVRSRRGVFEQAQGGTLFLDEIAETSPAMQVKLLRAIQERQIARLGGERSIPVEIRLICATNKDLKSLVEAGRFREDLYYRINVIHLQIPPLRDRQEDILWLARSFLTEFAVGHRGAQKRLSAAAESALLLHTWPGNVRELKHCIERACILAEGTVIEPRDLFGEAADLYAAAGARAEENLGRYLETCERDYILRALDAHGWQITETAASLGISRKNLWEKMRKLHLRDSGDAA